MPNELPTDYNEWNDYVGPNGVPRISISPPAAVQADPLNLNSDPAIQAYQAKLPIKDVPKPTTYIMEPDLIEAQTGKASLPPDVTFDDAGFAYNKVTGNPIKIIRRPNVLPIARTPDGDYTLAMPKMLDLVGNVMGNVAAPAVATKAGEVVLGSGAVRTAQEAAKVAEGPFYSALSQAVDNAKIGKASADQWLGYLKNQPGVKSEEINTVLGGMEGSLTKQQVQDIVKTNKVSLGEVNKGSTPIVTKPNPEEPHILEVYHPDDPTGEINGMWGEIINKDGKFTVNVPEIPRKSFNSQAEAEKFIADNSNLGSNTKYHGYQLPGAEPGSYKETLLTLPDKVKTAETELKSAIGDGIPWGKGKLYSDEIIRGLAKEDLSVGDLPKDLQGTAQKFLNIYKNNNNFKSSHWDEPNIIAHIRHNDRIVDGKKTLHLEEIQSDWHQKGRAEGYKLSDKQRKDLDNIESKLTSNLTEAEIGNPDIDNVLKVAVDNKVITPDEAKNYKDYVKGENSTVPDAPFKKNWDELALKRMLHKAATEGYEGLSWTPGEAQAARYDLSKQIDSIAYNPNTGYFKALDKTGRDISTGPVPKEKLADTIGKEAAEKLLKTEPNSVGIHSLQKADLKIGGEGMKSFYDKMLVDKANALGKKYGSKVEQRDIATKNPNLQVEKSDAVKDYPYVVKGNYDSPQYFKTKEEAQAHVDAVSKKQPIHYLPITPELRAKAKSGFPLFSSVPITVPVQGNPFEDQRKQYKLTPVPHNPFGH